MLLVDTNILIDVLTDDEQWAEWSVGQLRAQSKMHQLVINPIIYVELSLTFSTVEALERSLEQMQIGSIELPRPALFLAGKALARFRGQGGTKSNMLADFFIGADAAASNLALLTRDSRRDSTYFPSVKLLTPETTSR